LQIGSSYKLNFDQFGFLKMGKNILKELPMLALGVLFTKDLKPLPAYISAYRGGRKSNWQNIYTLLVRISF